MRVVKCAGCRANIFWKYTQKGNHMPLDAEPTNESGKGVYVLDGPDHIKQYEPLFDGNATHYMNHWTTCPAIKQFKKATSRKD